MILSTERLILRRMTEADFPALCKILCDEETMYAYNGAFTEAEAHVWLEKQLERYAAYGYGLWAVTRKGSDEMIGQCGVTIQLWRDKEIPEVGYLLQKAYWHNGYAAEAARACREYAFETLNFPEVYSIIRDSNAPSQAVARRNGMTPVDKWVKHYRGIDMPHTLFCVRRDASACPVWEKPAFDVTRRKLPALSVLGRKAAITGQNTAEFETFWALAHREGTVRALKALALRDGATGGAMLGISRVEKNPECRAFDFYIAAECPKDARADGLERFTVPACEYAVFTARGKMPMALVNAEIFAFSKWLPASGFRHAHAPEMEAYPQEDSDVVEFYLPIERA